MAFAFDSLGYAKHLREAGVPQDQAEAHAEAAGQFIMAELATRYDLGVIRNDLDVLRRELETKIDAMRAQLESKIDTLSLRLTVRMGVMLAAGVAARRPHRAVTRSERRAMPSSRRSSTGSIPGGCGCCSTFSAGKSRFRPAPTTLCRCKCPLRPGLFHGCRSEKRVTHKPKSGS